MRIIDSVATQVAEKTIAMQEEKLAQLLEEKLGAIQRGGVGFYVVAMRLSESMLTRKTG